VIARAHGRIFAADLNLDLVLPPGRWSPSTQPASGARWSQYRVARFGAIELASPLVSLNFSVVTVSNLLYFSSPLAETLRRIFFVQPEARLGARLAGFA